MNNEQKVSIKLDPYNAMAILSFLREFINDEDMPKDEYMFTAIREAVDEYEKELTFKMTTDLIAQCNYTNNVNQLIGKSPKKL